MNKVSERAGSLGLFATANAFADAKLDPDVAPRDPRLKEAAATDLKRLFGQMARRGHDLELVRAGWKMLERRPLERALFAVDVLAQSILPQNEPILLEMRTVANMLGGARPLGVEVGIDLNKVSASHLTEQHARRPEIAASDTVDLLPLAFEHHLGALAELHQRGDALISQAGTCESIQAFARLAALARLPTLASVYLDWLVRGVGWRVPVLDLCDTLLDAGVPQKIPGDGIQAGDIPEKEMRDSVEYLVYRTHLSLGDYDRANALLSQNMEQRPRWIGTPSYRLDAVRGHLGALFGHSNDVTLARIEAVCMEDRLWRYGAKVRAIVAAARQPGRASEMFHAYVGGFGNDYDMTFSVISLAPEQVKRDVARILAREAYYLPHEPAVWKLLAALAGNDKPVDEVDARLKAQAR
ncbi:MAG TPA: hypothetical protein VMZ53_11385 [Kofleriaceae bacterium]|nr:hypothetical protein [Kofleriaceae bacterium]